MNARGFGESFNIIPRANWSGKGVGVSRAFMMELPFLGPGALEGVLITVWLAGNLIGRSLGQTGYVEVGRAGASMH